MRKSQNECEREVKSRLIRNLGSSKRGLLICSLNAPSLRKHKDEIEVLMRENKIDILALNETKLDTELDSKTEEKQVSIPGYTVLRCDRNSHGGGVAIYLRDTLNFEHRTDLKTDNLEMICIELKPKCSKPFILLAWYRPPNYETNRSKYITRNIYTNRSKYITRNIGERTKETILIGDVNCNDLDLVGKNKVLEILRNIYREYQLKQLIRNPTRSTLTSQTLIDHFATNKPKLIINFGVFTIAFSDPDLIFGIRKVSSRVDQEPKIIKSRQLKNYDPVTFCRDLEKVNWDLILKQDSVHAMSSEFENCFVTILDKHAPLRQHKVRNTYAPYIDHELRHKMFLRDFYKKQLNETKNLIPGNNSSNLETKST